MARNEARALRLVLAHLREFEYGDTDELIDTTQAIFDEIDREGDLQHVAEVLVSQLANVLPIAAETDNWPLATDKPEDYPAYEEFLERCHDKVVQELEHQIAGRLDFATGKTRDDE